MDTMELVLLLLSVPVALPAKHSLTYFLTMSSGIDTFPEFVAVSMVDSKFAGYCDSNNKTAVPRQPWVQQVIDENPQHREWHVKTCTGAQWALKADIEGIKQHYNQMEGVHVFQERSTCVLDDELGQLDGTEVFGYDGEDFMSLDLGSLTWVYTELSIPFKQKWDGDKARIDYYNKLFTSFCPQWLREYLSYGNSSLLTKVRPSVSLLQKTPSSPVTCHATGFYPEEGVMFWTKDGEELHEDVYQGEVLPNHDGTFQMSIEMPAPLEKPEDWGRYECVFQLSDVKEPISTKLDKAAIRTNWVPPSQVSAGAIGGVVVVLLLLIICSVGFFLWRRKNHGFRPANTSDTSPSSVKVAASN